MTPMLSAKRKNDALITIRQDNDRKTIEISGINAAAEKLTGFPQEELNGQLLDIIIPERIQATLHEYVEYDDPTCDFASVVRRIPNFQITNKDGKTIPVSLKAFYLTCQDLHKPEFEILLRDVTLIQRMEELRAQLAETQENEKDSDFGVPTSHAIHSALEVSHSFIATDPIEVSFAIVSIDDFVSYTGGQRPSVESELVRTVAASVRKTCRDEDIIGYLGKGSIGVVLINCSADNAKAVLNRVKGNITKQSLLLDNGTRLQPIVSIVYHQIRADDAMDKLYAASLEGIKDVQSAGGNRIHAL